jgi:Mrp family chromosome partitioning ATPase
MNRTSLFPLRADLSPPATAHADQDLAHVGESPALSATELRERSLICNDLRPRPEVNAFRELRTRLLAAAGERSFVTLVAPVSSGGGGSYVCRNLAAAFAFDENKSAAILDCNPYHPSQAETMRIEPTRGGLIDYLRDPDVDIGDILYETGMPRLRLIPVGTLAGSGSEHFSSFRMQLLLDALRDRYPARYLFLDCPAINTGPDARILADLVDVVVLVSGYGRDSPGAIAQAAANFDPEKFAGVVFNHGA